MKVLVLGSSGIIGQHLRASVPRGVDAYFHEGRRDCDLSNGYSAARFVHRHDPELVINLAGESNTDTVEAHQCSFESINAHLPHVLAEWARFTHGHLIHISSQAVFGGKNALYAADGGRFPINAYGSQKLRAEESVLAHGEFVTVIRPTFVLGVRPENIGRKNPIEQMLEGQSKQVCDRWFSPSFAPDVARCIWEAAGKKPSGEVIHAGVPMRTSRYDIAVALGLTVEPVSHEDFPGIAPRPVDTTYAQGAVHWMTFEEGIADCLQRYQKRRGVAA